MQIQLRSEETGILRVSTIIEAYEETRKDPSIWKISFITNYGEHIRLIRNEKDEFVLDVSLNGLLT